MKLSLTASGLFALLFCLSASGADKEGSSDHPLVKRIDGSEIIEYEKKAFDDLTIPLEKIITDINGRLVKPFKQLVVEGAHSTLIYRLPENASLLECVRGLQADLAYKKFSVIYQGASNGKKDDRFTKVPVNTLAFDQGTLQHHIYKPFGDRSLQDYSMRTAPNYRYLAMKRGPTADSGEAYVTIWCGVLEEVNKSAPSMAKMKLHAGSVIARVDVLEQKAMDNRMVSVNAEEMADQIGSTGKVALYGIFFDTNKAEVKPESDATLEEIAKLVKGRTGQRFLVVGHTDNVGGYEANKALSERRATAVVAALTSKFGVDTKALVGIGDSFSAPVAPNTSEDGRAKNRRVELVAY